MNQREPPPQPGLRRLALQHPSAYSAVLSAALFVVVYVIGSGSGLSTVVTAIAAAGATVLFGVGFAMFLRRRAVTVARTDGATKDREFATSEPRAGEVDPSSFTRWVMQNPLWWGVTTAALVFLSVATLSEGRFTIAAAVAVPFGALNAWLWRPGGWGIRQRAKIRQDRERTGPPGP